MLLIVISWRWVHIWSSRKTDKKWYWSSSARWLDFFPSIELLSHQSGIFCSILTYLSKEALLSWELTPQQCWAISLDLSNILLRIFFWLLNYHQQELNSYWWVLVDWGRKIDRVFLRQHSKMLTWLHRTRWRIFFWAMPSLGFNTWVARIYRRLTNTFRWPSWIDNYFSSHLFLLKLKTVFKQRQ